MKQTFLFLGIIVIALGVNGVTPRAQSDPPPGFVSIFNGKDLSGWRGLMKGPNDNPIKRAAASPDCRSFL